MFKTVPGGSANYAMSAAKINSRIYVNGGNANQKSIYLVGEMNVVQPYL